MEEFNTNYSVSTKTKDCVVLGDIPLIDGLDSYAIQFVRVR